MSKKVILVDIAFEEATELIELTQSAMKKGIELVVVSENAEYNGGWPVIRFGSENSLQLLDFLNERGFDFTEIDLIEIDDEVTQSI